MQRFGEMESLLCHASTGSRKCSSHSLFFSFLLAQLSFILCQSGCQFPTVCFPISELNCLQRVGALRDDLQALETGSETVTGRNRPATSRPSRLTNSWIARTIPDHRLSAPTITVHLGTSRRRRLFHSTCMPRTRSLVKSPHLLMS